MSSNPSEEGIQSLRLVLDRLVVVSEQVASYDAQIAERQQRLKTLLAEKADLAQRVPKMLESMDLVASDNYGWEPRIVWALRELARQFRASVP